MSYKLIGLGNPLLDMSAVWLIYANSNTDFLKKHSINANDAILVDEARKGIYEDLSSNYPVQYLAGGAAQNSIRAAQYVLPPNSTAYFGCVGEDKYADILRDANEKEGVKTVYMVKENIPTGKCAVVITGVDRSLVTDLAAANEYKVEHMLQPENWQLIEEAKFYYVGGYHLTVCVPAIKALGEEASAKNKVFIMNLSAPFLAEFFKEQMDSVSMYWDFLIGNSDEALAYAKSHGLNTTNLSNVAAHIAKLPKRNEARPRYVIITQGAGPTIVTKSIKGSEIEEKKYLVPTFEASQIVDSNGAGDAFAGAFVAGLVQNLPIPTCVDMGHWLAQLCLQENGPHYPFPKKIYHPQDERSAPAAI